MKQPLIKINLEVAGGIIHYTEVEGLNDKSYGQGGLLAHIWMPRTNEKLYFRTGLLFTSLEDEGENISIYKIPFQIEYLYPKGRLRPKVAIGINLYRPLYQSIAVMGGVNIKLTNTLDWSINYELDFNPKANSPLIPNRLLSWNLSTGIYFKL